jgi:uncharacterized alpha-E superfamily protein
MLLSRVAENLYWAGRYLERAEGTARIIREHTNLLVDLPTRAPVTWEPLLAVVGQREGFDARYPKADEPSILKYLVGDPDHAGSVLSSIAQARENLRTTREVFPREAWAALNDLYLYMAGNHTEGVARRSRSRFLERVIAESQRVVGILTGTMRRDEAWDFWRLGMQVERADMTTRVLDVLAGSVIDATEPEAFANIRWMSVLRSLSALQMFHRATHEPVSGEAALHFLLFDDRFPRAVTAALGEVEAGLSRLPRPEEVLPACAAARVHLAAVDVEALDAARLHDLADDLQVAIGAIHERVAECYFLPVPAVAHS